MDLKELQSIANEVGGVVLVENGEPKFIILSYKKFSELSSKKKKVVKEEKKKNDTQTNLGLNQVNQVSPSNKQKNKEENDNDNNNDSNSEESDDSELLVEKLNEEISSLRDEIETEEKLELIPGP